MHDHKSPHASWPTDDSTRDEWDAWLASDASRCRAHGTVLSDGGDCGYCEMEVA